MKPDKTHHLKIPLDVYPNCPECQMRMIVVSGFGLDPEEKAFEMLEMREDFRRGHVARKPLATWLMMSRSHPCAGWLSSRRGQIMAASIGLGERDNCRKTSG